MTVLTVSCARATADMPELILMPRRFGLRTAKAIAKLPAIGLGTSLDVDLGSLTDRRLSRLRASEAFTTKEGQPTAKFQHDYQSNVEQTESAIQALAKGQINLNNIVQILLSTQQAAGDATRAAEAAQAQVTAQAAYARVRDSYSDDGVLTAQNVAGSVTITIGAHQRHYIDPVEDVALNSGLIAGLPAATTFYVYYDDPDLTGGAVTYNATQIEADTVATASVPYRHSVGTIATPTNTGSGSAGPSNLPAWKRDQLRLDDPTP